MRSSPGSIPGLPVLYQVPPMPHQFAICRCRCTCNTSLHSYVFVISFVKALSRLTFFAITAYQLVICESRP
jgi:hypothetical protein